MTYIHELSGWPAFTWDASALSGLLGSVRHKQGRLLGRMESLDFGLRSLASLTTLTSDVVRSSAIEGVNLNPEEVRSSIARRLGLDFAELPRTRRDVEGFVELMLDATQNFRAPLSKPRLFDWHAALFPTGRSGMHRIVVGDWRKDASGPMQVVSDPPGREKVHFEAPEAGRLEAEMETFLNWFNAADATDVVLRSGIAHLWLVTIHPFEDGNGRITRAVADRALARSDGTKDRFYSMSAQIASERRDYYDELEAAQRRDLDLTPWLFWYLGCLDRAIDGAESALSAVFHKARVCEQIGRHSVNDRQRMIINRLLDGFEGLLTTSKYAKLAKCSTDTALRDVTELIDAGLLVRNESGGRSTSYRLSDAERPKS